MEQPSPAEPRWWTVRPARNLKAATYRCPLCDRYLSSLSDHLLIAPEGVAAQRRHAHTACVLAARRRGGLLTRDEWRANEPRRSLRSRLRRLRG